MKKGNKDMFDRTCYNYYQGGKNMKKLKNVLDGRYLNLYLDRTLHEEFEQFCESLG